MSTDNKIKAINLNDIKETLIRNTYFETLLAINQLSRNNLNYNEHISKLVKKQAGTVSDQLKNLTKSGIVNLSKQEGRIKYFDINYPTFGKILFSYAVEKYNEISKYVVVKNEDIEYYIEDIYEIFNINNYKKYYYTNEYFHFVIKSFFDLFVDMKYNKLKININSDLLEKFSINDALEFITRNIHFLPDINLSHEKFTCKINIDEKSYKEYCHVMMSLFQSNFNFYNTDVRNTLFDKFYNNFKKD